MQISENTMMRISQLLGNSCGWSLTPSDNKRVKKAIDSVCDRQTLDNKAFLSDVFVDSHLQHQLIDELVIPETYFFRYSESFEHLRECAEQWLIENETGVLRVASIPSATGEECYSIAMILHDAGIPLERFIIDALDVSAPLVEKAKEGIYSRNCLHRHPLVEQQKYFDEVSGGLQVKAEIRQRINFVQGNVKKLPTTFFESDYAIIFCRNLLIYLTGGVRTTLFQQLERMLKRDGLLFVGPAEVTYFLQQGMQPVDKSQVFLLQFSSNEIAASKPATIKPLKIPSKVNKALKLAPLNPFKIETTRKSVTDNRSNTVVSSTSSEDPSDQLIKIRQLADSGDLPAAYQMTKVLLTKEKTVQGFLLQGEILLAMERLPESIQAMKKVLYMAPSNEEALSHLILICRRNGNLKEAMRYQESLEGVKA